MRAMYKEKRRDEEEKKTIKKVVDNLIQKFWQIQIWNIRTSHFIIEMYT